MYDYTNQKTKTEDIIKNIYFSSTYRNKRKPFEYKKIETYLSIIECNDGFCLISENINNLRKQLPSNAKYLNNGKLTTREQAVNIVHHWVQTKTKEGYICVREPFKNSIVLLQDKLSKEKALIKRKKNLSKNGLGI